MFRGLNWDLGLNLGELELAHSSLEWGAYSLGENFKVIGPSHRLQ